MLPPRGWMPPNNIKKLQTLQNRALKIIFYIEKNTKKIHKLADINNISEFNETIITNFTHKQDSIPNNLINEIDQYTMCERLRLGSQKGRKHRNKLIYLPNRTRLEGSPQRNLWTKEQARINYSIKWRGSNFEPMENTTQKNAPQQHEETLNTASCRQQHNTMNNGYKTKTEIPGRINTHYRAEAPMTQATFKWGNVCYDTIDGQNTRDGLKPHHE